LVLACALADTPGVTVHLVESNGKKAAFLREAAKVTAVPAIIHAVRIVDFVNNQTSGVEVVTARALAPLPELLSATYPLLKKGTIGLFPKGQDVEAELTAATKCWNIQSSLEASLTDPKARIVKITGIDRKPQS
jgi:16S rRNA (guanine527-N7)-methyltransferase